MTKLLSIAFATVFLGLAMAPLFASDAAAQQRTTNCRYTSADIKKGYRC